MPVEAAGLTFFTAPRPFTSDFDRIQRNAIHSWTQLVPRPEVLVFASDPSAIEACASLGARLIREVPSTPSGAPMLDAVFARAHELATHDVLVYANPDIILLQDIVDTFERAVARFGRCVAVAAPRNSKIRLVLDGAAAAWTSHATEAWATGTPPNPGSGADVFMFPRGAFDPVPAIAIGRLGWDNWLLWRAATGPFPSVDLTDAATVVHQDHSGTTHRGSVGVTGDRFADDVRNNLARLRRPEQIARRSEIGWTMTGSSITRKQVFGPNGARVRVGVRSLRLRVNPLLERTGLLGAAKAWQQARRERRRGS